MNKRSVSFQESKIEFLKNPNHALEYLNLSVEEYEEDDDLEIFLLALRDIAEAQGGLGKLSKKSKLNRQNLYKTLSEGGEPYFRTVMSIARSLGMKLRFEY